MLKEMLNVVTCISNPVRWESRIRLYNDFEQHILDSGAKLTVVENTYGEHEPQIGSNPKVNYIRTVSNGTRKVWNKENLLNIGVQNSPTSKYFAFVDADIEFLDKDWVLKTLDALQHYHVIQPWSYCHDLGPDGEVIQKHRSLMNLFYNNKPISQGANADPKNEFGHPGFAWAWTRQALDWVGGLVETGAMGAGDHHMGMGLIGKVADSIHGKLTDEYKAPLLRWEKKAMDNIKYDVGCLDGKIRHFWHGSKEKRAYVDRWNILVNNKFDPALDLTHNSYGVLELTDRNPKLRRDIDAYFRSRDEDATDLGKPTGKMDY